MRLNSLVISTILLLGMSRGATALDMLTTDNPPFSYSDRAGKVIGMSADIVTEMGRRANVPMTVSNRMPWIRAYRMVQIDPNSCAFSVSRLPEREALFRWIGPIASNKWALFVGPDFTGTVSSLDDAKKYRIGGLLEDAKAAYLTARGFSVDAVPNDRLNPAKLLAGHIDLWVTGLHTAVDTADAAGVSGIKPIIVFKEVDSYLVCHPQAPAETIERLSRALDAMRREGFVKKVQDRYNNKFSGRVDELPAMAETIAPLAVVSGGR